MTEKASWGFAAGDEIAPGRTAIKRLGGGSRFEVYLAADDLLMQTVVVKVLRPDRVEKPKALAALRAEAEALAELNHPVIVRCFDTTPDGPRPHLVLEHVEGPTLRRLVKDNGPLPIEQVAPLALQICSALHYMGRLGWVHLDVKPSNIVMHHTPRLIDLSVARRAEVAARLESLVGTSPYMSPEQCAPGIYGRPGPASDVWGLGMSLFYAVAAKRPFAKGDAEAATAAERYPQLNAQPDAPPKRVPPALAGVIGDCLRKDPSARPSPAEIAERLEGLIAGVPRRPPLGRKRPRGV